MSHTYTAIRRCGVKGWRRSYILSRVKERFRLA